MATQILVTCEHDKCRRAYPAHLIKFFILAQGRQEHRLAVCPPCALELTNKIVRLRGMYRLRNFEPGSEMQRLLLEARAIIRKELVPCLFA